MYIPRYYNVRNMNINRETNNVVLLIIFQHFVAQLEYQFTGMLPLKSPTGFIPACHKYCPIHVRLGLSDLF